MPRRLPSGDARKSVGIEACPGERSGWRQRSASYSCTRGISRLESGDDEKRTEDRAPGPG